MKAVILLLICFVGITACTSKISKWNGQITRYLETSDSIQHLLLTEIDSADMTELLENAKLQFQSLKLELKDDTLNRESLKTLDNFNVAYTNSKYLSTEYTSCKMAAKAQKKRLVLLQSDITNGSGDRSTYCASIQKEKDELTIIRMHAIDIRRRFEELKSSMEQFQPLLTR